MFATYMGNRYDLYVINNSTLLGRDYIIPKNITVQFKNTYRGKVVNPFKPDGSIDFSAHCTFNNVNFATRVVNGIDILKYSKKEIINNGSYANYISHMLRSDIISPLPNYYNIEDQARLAKGDFKGFDLETCLDRYEQIPDYTLGDFRDTKTTYITLEIHEDNLFQNKEDITSMLFPYEYSTEKRWLMELIRDEFMSGFLDCYDIIMKSIFAQAYIIFDIDSGIFSIVKEALTLKHSYNISKDEVSKEYAAISLEIEAISDNLSEVFSADHSHYLECIPTRVSFYISPTLCKIKFSDPDRVRRPAFGETNILGSSEYSASDADESSLAKEFGESMLLSEYTDECDYDETVNIDEYDEYGIEKPDFNEI
jgi:hypothetical protein